MSDIFRLNLHIIPNWHDIRICIITWARTAMSHKVDTDTIERNSFLLRHLALGNRGVSSELHFDLDADRDEANGWGKHSLQLEMLVSELLIETAVKFRVILDVIRTHTGEPIEKTFQGGDSVGHFLPEMGELRIREACNKVLHADGVSLNWQRSSSPAFDYWDGTVTLKGTKGQTAWQCSLTVGTFSDVLNDYMGEILQRGDYYGAWSR